MLTPENIVLATLALTAVCTVGEWLHARRCRRAARLAFGVSRTGWPLVLAAAVWRTTAITLLGAGLLTLTALAPRAHQAGGADDEAPHHLIIAMDVSPSMHLKDAGPQAGQSRADRARAVLRSVLDRLDMSATRVSIVAFYTEARPVIVDTRDPDVVNNVLNDLPLEHAFKPGKTNLYEGARVSAELAKTWPVRSTTLLIVSDGDTLPGAGLPPTPPSIGRVAVLGVGNPHRGVLIDGHASRQDIFSLNRLALRLGGRYHDVNEKHLPSESVRELLSELDQHQRDRDTARLFGLIAVGVGAGALAMISPILALAGAWIGRQRLATTFPAGLASTV